MLDLIASQRLKFTVANMTYYVDYAFAIQTLDWFRLKYLDETSFSARGMHAFYDAHAHACVHDASVISRFIASLTLCVVCCVELNVKYGYAPKGERLVVRNDSDENVTYSVTVTTSLTGGLAVSTMREGSNSAIDFLNYVLGLIRIGFITNGDILICDNASIHRSVDIVPHLSAALTAAGIRMIFLPVYSPELSPVELVFNKVKNELRYRRGSGLFANEISNAFNAVSDRDLMRFYVESIDGQIPSL